MSRVRRARGSAASPARRDLETLVAGRSAAAHAPAGLAPTGLERIAKRIGRSGFCSRREAERLIEQGRVVVDGKTVAGPALKVPADARILIDGQMLAPAEPSRLVRFAKPRGVITARSDARGRSTIYDHLPEPFRAFMPVGRLDFTSEGLLLLTNDGELKRHIELPATGWTRRYRVRVFGEVDAERLAELKRGIEVEGMRYGPIEARLDRGQGDNAWLTLALKEGKNREVRKVMAHFGWQVNRLIRTAYGPFQIGALADGEVSEVPAKVIREQLGPDWAERLEGEPPGAGPKRRG